MAWATGQISVTYRYFLSASHNEPLIQELSLKPSIVNYRGKLDKQGAYHGEGEARLVNIRSSSNKLYLRYSNGSLFYGTFKHGLREGHGCLESMVAGVETAVAGHFVQDK